MPKTKLQALPTLLICLCALASSHVRADFQHADSVQLLRLQTSPVAEYALQMELLVGARRETLLLNPSTFLNDANIVDQHGAAISPPANTRYYGGVIENLPDSWVRIALGEELRGIVSANGEHYDIQPTGDTARLRHISAAQIQRTVQQHGSDQMLFPPVTGTVLRSPQQVITIDGNPDLFFNQADDATKVVHIGIVIDSRYDEARAGRGVDLAMAAINSVDGLYREQMGIAVRLDTTLVMTDPATDPLRLDDHSTEEMLLAFRNYRRNTDLLGTELNLVHFFTGNPSIDANIGLAFIGAACRSDGYDVSLSVPFQYPVLLAAHEIGHNLGALHDDVTSCSTDNNMVMHSQISSQTSEAFSHCSLDAIAEQLTHATCLSDAIDLQISAVKLSDSQAQIEAQNLDLLRAVAGSQLRIELTNARILSLPANCTLDSPSRAHCPTAAISAGNSQSVTFEYQLLGTEQSTLYSEVEVIGALDLQPANNNTTVVLAEDTTPQGDPNMIANTDPAQSGEPAGGSAGGGAFGILGFLVAAVAVRGRRRLLAPIHR